MYNKDKQPIPLKELDLKELIALQDSDEGPLVKLLFSLDTPYLKRDFNLDLIIWNLSEDNLAQTERVVRYVFKNFSRLFETGWTTLYHHLCSQIYSETAEHTIEEFFEQQIDFEDTYYTIQLEINCEHLKDGKPRYCFVVATPCDDWMIADDDMRVYMIGNKVSGFNDNNDDGQMQASLEDCAMFYGLERESGSKLREMLAEEYKKMVEDGFQFAEPFPGV